MNPFEAPVIIDKSKDHLSGLTTIGGNRFYDNSMLDTMRVCPRRFYFRHIKHWELDGVRAALIFGSSWHSGMDYLWQNPSCKIDEAFDAFMKIWNASDLRDADVFDLYPRSPQRAKDMLIKYQERYGNWLANNIELLSVEKPFIVPLSEDKQNLFYVGKLDKQYREYRFIYTCDHKTSSSFSTTWLNSWSPNGQVDGYLFAGHMEYGSEFKGVVIDGALVQKTSIDFKKIPVERQIDMLDNWKWEVLDLIEQIWYYETLLVQYRKAIEIGQVHSPFLATYPKCTTSCTSYYGACPYLDLCKFIPNPEIYKDEEPPAGFIKSTWKPFEVDETPEGEFVVKIYEHINEA